MKQRNLTEQEKAILKIIQVNFGSHNTENNIMFTDESDAVIWVKDENGNLCVVADLTNLAAWRTNGTISTEEELLHWLNVG